MKFLGVLIFLVILCGCERHYLSVSQQWVDANYLASTKANTPDPKRSAPPTGQMLVIEWFVPSALLKKEPYVELEMIFWDYTSKKVHFPVDAPLSWVTYKCLDQEYQEKKGILTYKATLMTKEGQVFKEWKHQLWVNLITI